METKMLKTILLGLTAGAIAFAVIGILSIGLVQV